MKNPFKKSSIVDTVVNVGLGGAANVAMDYAVQNVSALASLGETTVQLIKIGVGAVAGSMTSNRYLRAAADGLATVGASELIKSYITPSDEDKTGNGGDNASPGTGRVPFMSGTSGKRMGYKNFRKTIGTVPFMS